MANYFTNTTITQPIDTGLQADQDLGGLKFSYEHGIFYSPTTREVPITLPPAWGTPA